MGTDNSEYKALMANVGGSTKIIINLMLAYHDVKQFQDCLNILNAYNIDGFNLLKFWYYCSFSDFSAFCKNITILKTGEYTKQQIEELLKVSNPKPLFDEENKEPILIKEIKYLS